jgi:hypothetical protein
MARREVISWDVTFAEVMTRRKSLNHWAEACFGKAGSEGEGEVGSADCWFREG